MSTGAVTTNEAQKIEIGLLLKNKVIEKGRRKQACLSLNGRKIDLVADYRDKPYLLLLHNHTDSYPTKKPHYEQRINLVAIPSNIGRCEILYFVWPATGNRCRILYRCYGSKIWKSMAAYKRRIYYPSQICSKKDYWTTLYLETESKVSRLLERKES